jgi:hypothetical protein
MAPASEAADTKAFTTLSGILALADGDRAKGCVGNFRIHNRAVARMRALDPAMLSQTIAAGAMDVPISLRAAIVGTPRRAVDDRPFLPPHQQLLDHLHPVTSLRTRESARGLHPKTRICDAASRLATASGESRRSHRRRQVRGGASDREAASVGRRSCP